MKGYTQDELAEEINKTRALISHIEQTGKINHYTLVTIAKALNVSQEDIESFDGKVSIAREDSPAYGKNETALLKQSRESGSKRN